MQKPSHKYDYVVKTKTNKNLIGAYVKIMIMVVSTIENREVKIIDRYKGVDETSMMPVTFYLGITENEDLFSFKPSEIVEVLGTP